MKPEPHEQPVTAAPPAAPRERLAPDIVATTREYLEKHLDPLRARAAEGDGGTALARRVATVYDGLLSAYFLGACAQRYSCGARSCVSLLAVGGYGRGALGLASELDLVVLTTEAACPTIQVLAETFLHPLWDSGVALHHVVRTPDDLVSLVRDDAGAAAVLLDARVVGGDVPFGRATVARAWQTVEADPASLLDVLATEVADRRARADVRSPEPDLLHGVGGLRDLDVARLALHARFQARDLADAVRLDALADDERDALESAADATWRLRLALHARAHRRVDRLTRELQPDVARATGQGVEAMLADHRRRALAASDALDAVLARCR